MPVATKDQALELLASGVQGQLGADELLEVYNEVFPDDPRTEGEDTGALVDRLVDYIKSGLEIDVILDLWGLIFPRHRNVWYDDEEEQIHYNDGVEAVPSESKKRDAEERGWDEMNARRIDLAEKKSRGELSGAELSELDRLQTAYFDYLAAKYPRTPVDLDRLAEIERRLNASRGD